MARAILSFIIIWAFMVYIMVPIWKWIVLLFRSEKKRFESQLTVEVEKEETKTKTKNMEDDWNEF